MTKQSRCVIPAGPACIRRACLPCCYVKSGFDGAVPAIRRHASCIMHCALCHAITLTNTAITPQLASCGNCFLPGPSTTSHPATAAQTLSAHVCNKKQKNEMQP
jgi:hypothetical protein